MIAAKNFQAGMIMVRQLEFSLFDFKIHQDYSQNRARRIYEKLLKSMPYENKFGDYCRLTLIVLHIVFRIFLQVVMPQGYYSYKWAEVLSSDAYSLFEENGIFDQKRAKLF